MITALVQFKLPQPVTREKAREFFSASAARYREVPGLILVTYFESPVVVDNLAGLIQTDG